jgi:MFS family permease
VALPGWAGTLSRDGWLLFATYGLRLFAYGFVSVVLGLYLAGLGFEPWRIGVVFTAALAGGAVTTGLLGTIADRVGRRRVLVLGAALMALAGAVFALSESFPLLLAAAFFGTVSPSGREVGPFLSIEQAMLPQTTDDEHRTGVFSAYNVVASGIGALGSLCAGLPALLGLEPQAGYRALMWAYAAVGLLLALLFSRLSDRVEAPAARRGETPSVGVDRSPPTVLTLAGLYALDSLGSGLVVQSTVSYWFHVRHGIDVKGLGAIAFGTDALATASFVAAPWVAGRVGLLNAAVLTHLVGSVFLVLVPLMPTWQLAVGAWLARYAFAQMDVPARQSYTMAILPEDERAAASGWLSAARNTASAVAPSLAGIALGASFAALPFVAAPKCL